MVGSELVMGMPLSALTEKRIKDDAAIPRDVRCKVLLLGEKALTELDKKLEARNTNED
jgi:hypothetical protein